MTSPDTEFISILGAAGNPEAPARVSAHSLPQVLPILGLSDIVIFPGMVAPLLVETPQKLSKRQRELLAEFERLSSQETQPETAGFFGRVKEFLSRSGAA